MPIGSNAQTKPLTVVCDVNIKAGLGDANAVAFALYCERQGLFKVGGIICNAPIYGMPAAFEELVNRTRRLTDGAATEVIIGVTATGTASPGFGTSNGGLGAAPVAAKRFARIMRGNASYLSDVRAYRKIFANAAPKSVIVAISGTANAFYNFLLSPADDICPLTGLALAQQGLFEVVACGGNFNPISGTAESNFGSSPAAWAYLFATVTFAPITMLGAGANGPMGNNGAPLDANANMDPLSKLSAYAGTVQSAGGAFSATIAAGLMTLTVAGTVSAVLTASQTPDNSGNLFGQVLVIPSVTTRNPIRIVGLVSGTKNTVGAVYSISDPTVSVSSSTAMTTKNQAVVYPNWSIQLYDFIANVVGAITNQTYFARACSVTMSSSTGVVSAITAGAGNVDIIDVPADASWAACAPVTARYQAAIARLFNTYGLPTFPAAMDPKAHLLCIGAFEPFNSALVSGTSGSTSLVIADPVSGGNWIVPATMGDSGFTGPTPTGPAISTTAAGLSSQAVAVFDGVANQMAQDALALKLGGAYQPFHAMYIIEVQSTTAAGVLTDIAIAGSQVTGNRIRIAQAAGGVMSVVRSGSAYAMGAASAAAPSTTSYHVVEAIYDPEWDPSCNMALIVDDAPPVYPAQSGNANNSVTLSLSRFRLGNFYGRGGAAADTAALGVQVNIAAAYFFNGVIDQENRDRILRAFTLLWPALPVLPL